MEGSDELLIRHRWLADCRITEREELNCPPGDATRRGTGLGSHPRDTCDADERSQGCLMLMEDLRGACDADGVLHLSWSLQILSLMLPLVLNTVNSYSPFSPSDFYTAQVCLSTHLADSNTSHPPPGPRILQSVIQPLNLCWRIQFTHGQSRPGTKVIKRSLSVQNSRRGCPPGLLW